ncbi:MAG: F0F1 ATP synthase subunit delta [Alphaproteobacteria bacterium]|nr:F0F1 ATP synthase subunit delta [Alphaproteobacteria bacterium]
MAGESTSSSSLAGRYATALVDLASEGKSLDTVAGELKQIKDLLSGSADLNRLVRSPVFSREEQGEAMAAILGRLNVSQLTKNFIGLVAQKRRLSVLRDIITAFEKIVAAQRGELSATVTSAQSLKAEQLTALSGTLKDTFKRDVRLSTEVDPSLIGGLVVKVGSRQIDTSLKTKLARLTHAMKEGA